MSNEEVDRRIVFIIEQQAQFTSDIQQLRESQAQFQATQVQTEQLVARLAHVTLEGFKDVNAKINALVDSQIHTDENLKNGFTDVNVKIKTLVDTQLRTDEHLRQTDANLRNLIDVAERYFNEGRNGG